MSETPTIPKPAPTAGDTSWFRYAEYKGAATATRRKALAIVSGPATRAATWSAMYSWRRDTACVSVRNWRAYQRNGARTRPARRFAIVRITAARVL